MKIIKVSSGNSKFSALLLRQTPKGKGIWGDCQFLVNQDVERCDWWVICHVSGLQKKESTLCDPDHIVYISMEPSERILDISNDFINQFSKIVVCDRNISHRNIKYANGITWWVGINMQHNNGIHCFSPQYSLDYDILTNMKGPLKKNKISVIVSKKNSLDGHKKRLTFVEKIKEYPIGKYIDIFGGGFNPIPDKWDAIAPYKYHLVLENSITQDYWSEKLADAFLGFAYPIYSGCPNIYDYFSNNALQTIKIDDIQSTVDILSNIIEYNEYEKHLESIVTSRNNVLNKYNIFQLMVDICNSPALKVKKCYLKPNYYYRTSNFHKIYYYIRDIRNSIIYNN